MHFEETQIQQELRALTRKFARKEIAPLVEEDERTETFRPELIQKLAAPHGVVLIDDHRREIAHARVDEPEENHLKNRDAQRGDERRSITKDVEKFFSINREKRAPDGVHGATSIPVPGDARRADSSCVNATKTSSSDGMMSRTST